ncbi:MAG: penicillin-binding protein 2, partial [Lachnospiraceae bacterium]
MVERGRKKPQAEGKRQRNTRKKSPEIIGITVGFTALFLVMMGYLVSYCVSHKEELFNNSYNNRQQIVNAQNRRGNIYAADGEILAQTVVDEVGNEKRVYPYENLFAHAIGYTGKGKSGVEEQMNY